MKKFKLGGAKDLTLNHLNDVINLPKYRGMTIKEIAEFDSEYVLWLYENKVIKPDEELMEMINNTYKQKSNSKISIFDDSDNYPTEDFWDSIFKYQ